MTDTVGDAILAAITANWNEGSGGTIPELYSKEDTQVMPSDLDFVWMLTDTADEDPAPFNQDFVIITSTIEMYVSSKQDDNREQRLDTIINELKRIINPTNVTGYKQVRVRRIRRLPSDKRFGVYAAIVPVFLKSSLVSHKVTPGSSENPTSETDELTVNVWLKTPLIKSADGTDTIELLAGEATFPNDVHMGSELKFSSAILHGASNAFHMHPASGNADILLNIHPLGTNTLSKLHLRNTVNPVNYGALELKTDGTTASINSIKGGSGTAPTTLDINDADWDAINIGDADSVTTVGGDLTVNGNVGLGVASHADVALLVQQSVVDGADRHIDDVIQAEREDDCNINLISKADGSKTSGVLFSDATRATGAVIYDHADDKIKFRVNSVSNVAELDGSGNLQIDGTIGDGTDDITPAQIADLLMFGSANATRVPLILEAGDPNDQFESVFGHVRNIGATDFTVDFALPEPCTKDTLKLTLKNLFFRLPDADENDYIDTVNIYGHNDAGRTVLDSDDTDHTSVGNKTFSGATMPAAAIDVSSYHKVTVKFNVVSATAAQLELSNVTMECYYTT